MSRLNGKVALVTGAARGIGEAIARAFTANGALVYITDIDDSRGREVAGSIGSTARYLRLDVREETDWQRVTAEILADRGALDVVVNNAGITGFEGGRHGARPRERDARELARRAPHESRRRVLGL